MWTIGNKMNRPTKSWGLKVAQLNRLLSLAAVLILYESSVSAQNNTDAVDAFIQTRMEERRIPGLAFGIIKNGSIERIAALGVTDLETQIPVTPETPFQIASNSKNVTAVTVMTLVEEGVLSLDDTIGTHLADIPEHWKPVTVRQLLNHTSGLPDNVISPFSMGTVADNADDVIAILTDRPLDAAPGER